MSLRSKKIELAAQDSVASDHADQFEGGSGDRQQDFFKREGNLRHFSQTANRSDATQADLGVISKLRTKIQSLDENELPFVVPDPSARDKAFERSFMIFEEQLDDAKDTRPLNQLKKLSEKYKYTHPSKMFYQSHMEQLRKYIDKSEEFRGQIVFFQNDAFILKPENMIAQDGKAYMNIKQINLAQQLDYIDQDVDDDAYPTANSITKSASFECFSVEKKDQVLSPAKSPGKRKLGANVESDVMSTYFLELMSVAFDQGTVDLVQNGQQVYFWTASLKQRGGKDFEQVDKTNFELVEIDLGSGKISTLKEYSISATDQNGWIPVSVGFTRRHTQKVLPWSQDVVKKEDFVKSLKNEVIIVREAKFWHGVNAQRVTIRSLHKYDQVLYTLFEGAFENKFHFVTQINSEDILRLSDRVIVNKLQIKSYEKIAQSVGLFYTTEDADSNGFYNIVQPVSDASGKVTGFIKYEDTSSFSATSIDNFKQRVRNCNYKYLYDEKAKHFFLRKQAPVYAGAAVITDLILNKIIFVEIKGDNTRLKVTNMKNHGTSFQKLTCAELSQFNHYGKLKEEYLTVSNLIATQIHRFDHKTGQQLIVSRTTKNMFRCEDVVVHLNDEGKAVCYDDNSLKVKSISLHNSDFISYSELRKKVDKLRSQNISQLTLIQSLNWQTKDQKPFLPIGKLLQSQQKYRRLVSSSGEYLLPRVTTVAVLDPNTNRMVSPKEPRIELFSFKVSGSIPTDDESEVIGQDQAWRVFNERVKFENDDSVQRPLIFSQVVKGSDGNINREHFWFTIYDFKAEQIVSQIHMNFPDLILERVIENIDVSACSEITQVNETCFTQRFQVCFYLKDQLRAKIIEYTVEWNYYGGRKVTIQHTCSKELLLKSPESQDSSVENEGFGFRQIHNQLGKVNVPLLDDEPVFLIPYMDKSNMICGTQFIYGGTQGARVFVMDNRTEESAIKNSKIPFVTDEGYKIYKNETYGQYTGIVAYSKLPQAMLVDSILSGQEKAEIIEDAVKAILNSVVFDPSMAVPSELRRSDFESAFLKAFDLGRGVEVLEWFSFVSLKCDSDSLEKIFEDCVREYEDKAYDVDRFSRPNLWSLSSLLERVLINDLIHQEEYKPLLMDGQKFDYDRVKVLAENQFYIKGHEIIQRDIFLNHPLHYLFDLEKETEPKDQYIDAIMKFTFSEHNNCNMSNHMEAQEHLMSMLGDILERDYPQKTYFDNFLAQKFIPDPTSNKRQNLQLNICQSIAVPNLPRNQGQPLQVFPYQHEVHEFRQNSNFTVEQFITKTSPLDDGQEHTVECLFFDMRFYIFEQKVKYIKSMTNQDGEILNSCYNGKTMPEFGFNSYELSNMILDIVEKTDGDIRKQKVLRHIIEYQYADTRKVNAYMLVGYTLGFFIPFFLQMYIFIEPLVLACNGLCLFTSLLLIRFEIEQLKLQGCSYFASFMNWIDLLGFFSYCFYFGLRVSDPSLEMPDYKQNFTEDSLTLLSFPLILYTSQKLLFYFKMFEQFGLFQQLVGATFGSIKVFLPFMFFWIYIFTSALRSLGATYPTSDYPDVNEFAANLLQTWRNSLGGVAVPDYSKWSDNLREEEKAGSYGLYSYFMIFLCWFIWYLNLTFILQVLANFLISIVGNSFGLIEQDVELIFAQKSDLNQEIGLFNKWQNRIYPLDSLIIVSEQEEQDDADEKVKSIATSLKDQRRTLTAALK